ncbi:MAG: hypothetical protein JXQ76_07860 [Campylobacterales bacterium]|nr:hypothetical protein [Campylobacterales bacterium]
MRYIEKNKTGIGYRKLLVIHKSKGCYEDTKNDNSKNPPITTRSDILQDLLDEQGSICAYCMRKISLESARIEHIVGQNYVDDKGNEVGKEEDTNYGNMLAVCYGDSCQNTTHCDSSRSKYQNKRPLLSLSPLNQTDMSCIKFTRMGVIYYQNLDEESEMNFDLDRVLNLNCKSLVESREKILRAIKTSLIKHKFNKKFVAKELAYWENSDKYHRAFCQVAIFELKKHL